MHRALGLAGRTGGVKELDDVVGAQAGARLRRAALHAREQRLFE
jgi:hypothetical protein